MLVVNDKNVVQRRAVKLGPEVKDLTVVTEGLNEQGWVITNGLLCRHPGQTGDPCQGLGPEPGTTTAPEPWRATQESRPMISKFFIDRPIFANVIAIVIVILGLVCLFTLPVAQYPEIVPPTIQVTTMLSRGQRRDHRRYRGHPHRTGGQRRRRLHLPVLHQFGSAGNYTLTVTFAVGTDLDTSLALVQNMSTAPLAQLPETVQAQGVTVRQGLHQYPAGSQYLSPTMTAMMRPICPITP